MPKQPVSAPGEAWWVATTHRLQVGRPLDKAAPRRPFRYLAEVVRARQVACHIVCIAATRAADVVDENLHEGQHERLQRVGNGRGKVEPNVGGAALGHIVVQFPCPGNRPAVLLDSVVYRSEARDLVLCSF